MVVLLLEMPAFYILYESASGYALAEVVEFEEIAVTKKEVQASIEDLGKFSRMVKLKVPLTRGGARTVFCSHHAARAAIPCRDCPDDPCPS